MFIVLFRIYEKGEKHAFETHIYSNADTKNVSADVVFIGPFLVRGLLCSSVLSLPRNWEIPSMGNIRFVAIIACMSIVRYG